VLEQVIGNVTLGQQASIWYGAILRGKQQNTCCTAVHEKLGFKPNPTGWNQYKAVLQLLATEPRFAGSQLLIRPIMLLQLQASHFQCHQQQQEMYH
jgi:hypothetical protein